MAISLQNDFHFHTKNFLLDPTLGQKECKLGQCEHINSCENECFWKTKAHFSHFGSLSQHPCICLPSAEDAASRRDAVDSPGMHGILFVSTCHGAMLSKFKNTLRLGKRVYDAFIVADRASAPGSTADHERPTKRARTTAQSLRAYGVYTEDEMAMAMFRVIVHGDSYRMAAGDSRRTRNKFLNKNTIQRRVMQWLRDRNYRSLDEVPKDVRRDVTLDELRSRAKVRQGAPRMLGSTEETALAAVLYALSLDGRSLTWDVVQPIVVAAFKTFRNANGVDGVGDADAENARVNPTKGWLASFLQRHPYLVERKGKMLEDARLAGEAKLPAFLDRTSRSSAMTCRMLSSSTWTNPCVRTSPSTSR